MRTFADKFNELINILPNSDIIQLFNEYASAKRYEQVFYMDDFDELMSGTQPSDLASMIFFGSFNPNHDHFTFNGYANLESIEYLDEWIKDYVSDMCRFYDVADRLVTLYH